MILKWIILFIRYFRCKEKTKINYMDIDKQKVYIIRNGTTNKYKIGISKDIDKRKKQLQTGNPNELKILFRCKIDPGIKAKDVELIIHSFLKENNKWERGEWFLLTEDQVFNIAKTLLNVGDSQT